MSVRETLRNKAKPRIDFIKHDGDTIHIIGMSGARRAQYMELLQKHKDAGGMPVSIIAAFGICETDGSLAYDHTKPEDLAELGAMDATLLQSAALKLFELSGLTEKAAEDIEKK